MNNEDRKYMYSVGDIRDFGQLITSLRPHFPYINYEKKETYKNYKSLSAFFNDNNTNDNNDSNNDKTKIIYKLNGGARGVMVIVVGNGHGDTSSNPGRDWLDFP